MPKVEAGPHGAPAEHGRVPRRDERRLASAARTRRTVEIDVVRQLIVGMVAQVCLDEVAFAHADDCAGVSSPKDQYR